MPVFTESISNQQTAYSARIKVYQNFGQLNQGAILIEQFDRNLLNPSGFPAYYTTGGVGSPTVVIGNNSRLQIQTSGTQNDNAACVMNQLSFSRFAEYVDNRSMVTMDIIFSFGDITLEQSFFGLVLNNASVLTALPTTAVHVGLYRDTSVSNNMILSSGNGSAQATTSTLKAPVINTNYRLNIVWTGNNNAVVSLYDTSPYTSLLKSQTVTDFGTLTSISNFNLHFFNQTLTGAGKGIFITEFQVLAT